MLRAWELSWSIGIYTIQFDYRATATLFARLYNWNKFVHISNMRILSIFFSIFFILPSLSKADSMNTAIQSFEQGRFMHALSGFFGLQDREPNNGLIAYYLGRIALHEGNIEVAADQLSRAVDLDHTNGNYHYWLGRAYGDLATHANIFKRAYYAKKTKEEFQKTLTLDPAHIFARVALVMYELRAPGFLGGSREQAEQNAAIAARHNAIAGYRAYGLIYEQDKDYERAIKIYEKAVADAPHNFRPYRWLAGAYRLQRKYDKAFQVYKLRINQPHPDWFAYYDFAATAVESGKQLQNAEYLLKAYITHGSSPEEPSISKAHQLLGEVLQKQRKKKEAAREFRAAREMTKEQTNATAMLSANRSSKSTAQD